MYTFFLSEGMAYNLMSHVVKQFEGSNFADWYFRNSTTLKTESLLSYITKEKPTLAPSDWDLKYAKNA